MKGQSRRQFFIDFARNSAGAGVVAALLGSIERASAIEPEPGSTYVDAEHVVILLQENDQNLRSRLTGTTPNRFYLWTGTIPADQNAASPANVRNSDVDYDSPVKWTTFSEQRCLTDPGRHAPAPRCSV